MSGAPNDGPATARPRGFSLAGWHRDEDGAAMLEFALILPVLLLLVAGCVEVGRTVFTYLVVENALRGGTRYLAQVPDPICRSDCSWGASHAIAMTRGQIQANTSADPARIRVWTPDDPDPGTVVLEAEVIVDFRVFPGFGGFGSWPVRLSRQERRIAG